MLGLLLLIPKDVVRDRILCFVDLRALVRLDSATMSHEHRGDVLTHVFSGALVEGEIVYKSELINWLISRNMQLRNVQFPEDSCDADLVVASLALLKASEIDLSNCNQVSNAGVQSLFNKVDSLYRVVLDDCVWLSDETLIALTDKHPNLSELLMKSSPLITDDAIACIAVRCEQLRSLQFQDCDQIGDEAMAALCHHGHITHISCGQCPLITEEAFLSFIALSQVPLHSVFVDSNNFVTDRVMINLAYYSPELRELSVNDCVNITDVGFAALTEICQDLQTLLVSIASEASLNTIGLCIGPVLQTLMMLKCPNLTDEHIENITSSTPMLETLWMSKSAFVSNRSLRSIGAHLPNLLQFKVSECPKVSFKGYRSLAIGCSKLEEFNVANSRNFQDNSLREVVSRCPNITELTLYETSVTDAGMEFVAEHSANLTLINIGYTYVREAGVKRLLLGCPKLTTIVYHGAYVSTIVRLMAQQRKINLILSPWYANINDFSDEEEDDE